MNNLTDNATNAEARIIWYVMLGATVLSIAFAGFSLFSFSLTGIIVLAISIFVSVLLTRYSAAIPNTRLVFSAKNIFTFWGIIWLGTGGGILLGASASLTRTIKYRNAGGDRIFPVFADIVATCISGFIFYVALGYTSALSGKLAIGDLGRPGSPSFCRGTRHLLPWSPRDLGRHSDPAYLPTADGRSVVRGSTEWGSTA